MHHVIVKRFAALLAVLFIFAISCAVKERLSKFGAKASAFMCALTLLASMFTPDCYSWNKNAVTWTSQNKSQCAYKCPGTKKKCGEKVEPPAQTYSATELQLDPRIANYQ